MATIRLVKGPERSDRSASLDALLASRLDTATLLVPTRTLARARLERLVVDHNLPGAWGTPVQSLEDFALRIVEGEGIPVIEIDELERRLLLEDAAARLRKQGRLDALGDASDSTGFINHALYAIAQLKQAAVEPSEFRDAIARRKRPSWLDAIVADVYDEYQAALLASQTFDRVGIYWQAALIAARSRPKGLGRIDTLILDGFDDFTPSEFRLVRALEPHLKEIAFGMVCSNMPTQQDLFALPLATERRIHEVFPVADVRTFPEAAPETYVHIAAARLFARDTLPLPGGLTPNIEILSCGDLTHEVETIGRRVKALLLEGVSPDRIAVAYRSSRAASPVMRSIFTEFGIPASFSAQPVLADSSLSSFLLRVFEASDAWRRDEVVEVLTSPWFMPDGTDQPKRALQRSASALLGRAAGIIEGRAEWFTRIDALASRLEDEASEREETLKSRLPGASDAIRDLKSRLDMFARVAESIPAAAPPASYVEACRNLLTRRETEQALNEIAIDSIRVFESSAYESILALLNRLDAWFDKDHDPVSISRNDFLAMLRREMAGAAIPTHAPGVAVRCMDMDALRRMRFDHLFLAGVNEGECPRPPAIRAIYGDEDIEDLAAAGIELDSKRKWAEREMLVFQQAVSAAETRLCITWRTLSASGRPMSPSPFIADIRDLFPGDASIPTSDTRKSFVPEFDAVASWRDLRNAALFAGGDSLAPFEAEFAGIVTGRDIERRRQIASDFDEYDGVVPDGEALAALRKRFGDAHVFSVRQVEAYAECPFQFFLNHVLRTEAEQAPAAELDPAVRGVLMHQALEAFHARYRGRSVSDIPQEEAVAAMQEIVSEVFRGGMLKRSGAPRGVVEAERRALANKLRRYLAIARNDEESEWKPTHFEVSFGPGKGASGEPPSRAEEFVLDTPAGPVKFAGRIDRIDLSEDRSRIIDYKTSVHVQSKHIRDGIALQMAVYAMALERHLLPGSECEQALLVAVGRKEKREALGRAKGEWETRAETACAKIAAIAQGIRSGEFPPAPYERMCNVCSASRVCRHEAGRIERKLESES